MTERAVEPREAEAPQQPATPSVLYIEDDVVNVLLVERIMEMRPELTLAVAYDASSGLELASSAAPQLILLDVRLPDMKGDDVLRTLRAAAATVATPIYMITADDSPALRSQLLALGATGVLTKPIDIKQLLEIVDNQVI